MSGAASLVSVIIPCYNQARYLGEAITSVLDQSYRPLEIVLVDDGSQDDTRRVAESFRGVRYLHQENQGTAAARNRGYRESRGAFLLFLDADDRLLPAALEAAVRPLEESPSCGFTYGFVRVILPDGSLLKTPPQFPVEKDHYLRLLRHNYIWTPGVVLYRRAAIESVGGFRPKAGGSADLDLNLRIARLWPVHCHGKFILEYRDHNASQNANAAETLNSTIRVRREHRAQLGGRRDYEEALMEGIRVDRAYYGVRLAGSVAEHFREGRWQLGLSELLVLVRYDSLRLVRQALGKLLRALPGSRRSPLY